MVRLLQRTPERQRCREAGGVSKATVQGETRVWGRVGKKAGEELTCAKGSTSTESFQQPSKLPFAYPFKYRNYLQSSLLSELYK